MGFSWALYFCQRLVERVVEGAGVPRERFIVDRQVPPAVGGDDYAVAVYVDGVVDFTESHHLAESKLAIIKAKLKEVHLDTSEDADDEDREASGQIFCGLTFNRGSGRVSVSPQRLWRLRLAIVHALQRGRLAPSQM